MQPLPSIHLSTLVTILTIPVIAMATADDSEPAEAAKPAQPIQEVVAAKAAPVVGKFKGTVIAIDPEAKTFTLKRRTEDRVIKVTESTRIFKDKKKVDFTALTVGAILRIAYRASTDPIEIIRIDVYPPVTPKEKDAGATGKRKPADANSAGKGEGSKGEAAEIDE